MWEMVIMLYWQFQANQSCFEIAATMMIEYIS